MAIKIKSMNGLAALKKLGVSKETCQWLEASPVQVTLSATKFRFTVPLSDGSDPTEYTVPVTLNQLQQLNAGTLSNAEKGKLVFQLVNVITEIMANCEGKLADTKSPAKNLTEDMKNPSGILSKLPPLASVDSAKVEEKAVAQSAAWPTFDLSKLFTANPVKLRDATMMYQPVMGTSSGSRYFMVAANAKIRVAARLLGESLSVRIEGPEWKNYVQNIKSCGFDKVEKEYASIHLNVGYDLVMASKTLGAILLGLGIPFETPLPELKIIKVAK